MGKLKAFLFEIKDEQFFAGDEFYAVVAKNSKMAKKFLILNSDVSKKELKKGVWEKLKKEEWGVYGIVDYNESEPSEEGSVYNSWEYFGGYKLIISLREFMKKNKEMRFIDLQYGEYEKKPN